MYSKCIRHTQNELEKKQNLNKNWQSILNLGKQISLASKNVIYCKNKLHKAMQIGLRINYKTLE